MYSILKNFSGLLLLCSVSISASAQNYTTLKTASKKVLSMYADAKNEIAQNNLPAAAEDLEQSVAADDKFIDGYLLLGELYNTLTDYVKGRTALLNVTALDADYSSKGYFFLAESNWNLNSFDSCAAACEKFLTFTDITKLRQQQATKMLSNARFAANAVKHPVPFDPKSLGDNVNSNYAEYLPSLTGDEQTIVFTRRIGNGPSANEDFYVSTHTKDGWMKAVSLGSSVNTSYNEGAQTITPDGNMIYYTACNRPGGYGSCDIYYAEKNGNDWSVPRNVGPPVSTPVWETQPSISANGKELYFVSSRPGGIGGDDIWVSYKNDAGKWSIPVDLGDSINTAEQEMSPFIHPDGQTLYFSSRGWPGMGGDDIFYSRKKSDGTWSTPVNIGYPINSKNDDNSFVVSLKGDHAYLSSDRFKSLGDMDLYYFDLYQQARPQIVTFLKGIITDAKTSAAVGATVELIDLETGKTIASSDADPTTGDYLVSIPAGKDYALNVSAAGYLFHSENFSLKNVTEEKPYFINVALNPIEVGNIVVLKNIFFETDSYVLKDESKVELNKLIELLQQNAAMKIQIGGHTDNQGSDEYNLKLSENRAKAVYDYLVVNGIADARLSFKGFGETKPIASNDTDDGRAQNRRTEFTVVAK